MVQKSADVPACPNLDFEQALWSAGIKFVAGVDEAGRGPLAGPVVAGAVILPAELQVAARLEGVRDSKQLSPSARQFARQRILESAIAWGVGLASAQEVDEMGIVPATRLAAQRALNRLAVSPEHILLDYLFLGESELPQTSLIKGDQRSLSIAAASVLAKTARDELMVEFDTQYPGYGLAIHKGYGTLAHREAIRRLGISPAHRRSFRLLKE